MTTPIFAPRTTLINLHFARFALLKTSFSEPSAFFKSTKYLRNQMKFTTGIEGKNYFWRLPKIPQETIDEFNSIRIKINGYIKLHNHVGGENNDNNANGGAYLISREFGN